MENPIDSLEDTVRFFTKAFPVSGPKNVRTQLGIMLEEIAETLLEVKFDKQEDEMLIGYLRNAIGQAGEHFKNSDGEVIIEDRVGFADGLCDIIVTAAGVGYHTKIDIVGAYKEVNRSNNSKFGADGEPILDKNLKLTKGPFYSKPELKSFV